MGAWGPGSFENDDAADFVFKFEDAPGWAIVEEAIAAVSGAGGDYLDADLASEAVAAAEIIAAKLGAPARDLPEPVTALLVKMTLPSPGLVTEARKAMVRVMDNSELAQLWSEDEERGIGQTSPDWLEAMESLLSRLGT